MRELEEVMLVNRNSRLACAATLLGAFLLPGGAHAIKCDDVALPNKIFGAGGSAVTATLRKIAVAIANDSEGDAAQRTTIFFADPGACLGFGDYLSGKTTRPFKYWVAGATAAETDKTCDAADGGQALDFSHMGNDDDLCPDAVVPDNVGDFAAPIQTVNLITGLSSNETSISAEALYFIFGYGPTGQAAPWTDGTGVFTRQSTAFVTYLVGAHIHVPATAFNGATKWFADDTAAVQKNGDIVTKVSTYSTDETKAAQALGYVSGSTADASRALVKTLAFQGFGQSCGVYPDSSLAALDKINVRRGKYALWAQGHYFTKVDGNGVPLNEKVANFINWSAGKELAPGTKVNPFEQVIQAGDIPECAMEALREGTTGAFYSHAPSKPCGCFFEKTAIGTAPEACESCEADADCGSETPKCNYGFCESYRADGEEEG
jgi:hypothetical protein